MNTNSSGHGKVEGQGSTHAGKTGQGLGTGPVGTSGRPGSGKTSQDDKGLLDVVGSLVSTDISNEKPQQTQSHSYASQYSGNASANSGSRKSSRFGTILKIAALVIGIIIVINLFKSCTKGPGEESGFTPQSSSTQSVPEYSYSDNESYVIADNGNRDYFTTLQGGGRDTVTLMIYMCGADLESQYGMATSDLQEIISGNIDTTKFNVIVETGGASKWQNNVISNKSNQRYQLTSKGLVPLESNLGAKSMTSASTLADFIQYCKKNFPANRYMLIFWDHGGGSVSGYGYDEKFRGASMAPDQIGTALQNGGVKFDIIGFDACLMANYETALVCSDYADYLIGSEETEPGYGWYYTNFISAISKNTSIDSVTLGKQIIQDYVSYYKKINYNSTLTLSLTDLKQLNNTALKAFSEFAVSTKKQVEGGDYSTVATARKNAREFATSSRINQIDLLDFANRVGSTKAKSLVSTLQSCIKYNYANVSGANGLSIYFPYNTTSTLNTALNMYKKIGMDGNYTECVRSFASLLTGGQIVSSSSGTSLTSLLGLGDYSGAGSTGSTTTSTGLVTDLLSGFLGTGSSAGSSGSVLGSVLDLVGSGGSSQSSGSLLGNVLGSVLGSYSSPSQSSGSSYGSILTSLFDTGSSSTSSTGYDLSSSLISSLFGALSSDRMTKSAPYYAQHYLDESRLGVTTVNGKKVVSLTEDEWDMIVDVAVNVFYDDGEGYIDLGVDNVFNIKNGNLQMDYAGDWMTISGHLVACYETYHDDENGTYEYRIPVLINDELADLLVLMDKYGNAEIVEVRYIYTEGETATLSKGTCKLKSGDMIQPICDYYSYDGKFLDSYKLGTAFAAGAVGTAYYVTEIINGSESQAQYIRLNLDYRMIEGNVAHCIYMYRLEDIYNNYYWTEKQVYGR